MAGEAHFFCTFLCRCFALLQRETFRNFLVTRFMEEMSYVFSFTFFSLPLIFFLHWWPLAFLILSPLLQNFHVVLPTKNCLLCFFHLSLQISVAVFLVEFTSLPSTFSFSQSFSSSIFHICGHDNYSELNTLDNAFSSLLTLQLSLLYKTPVAMRFPAKITASCISVAIPVD